jgi:outer membrane protein assembly factor BamB
MRNTLITLSLVLAAAASSARLVASDPGSGDWPMWGGTPDRNMVSNMKGLPAQWDVKTKKNIRWVADLGSQSYGNIVVAGGVVLIGTNNERLQDTKQPGDRGVLMAFRESNGEFLWQHTHGSCPRAGRTTGRIGRGLVAVGNGLPPATACCGASISGLPRRQRGPITTRS